LPRAVVAAIMVDMRGLAMVFVLTVVGCGGKAMSRGKAIPPVDGGNGEMATVCNVLTQTGCKSGEQCTWIIDMADMTSSIGHVGCAPAGDRATGAPCTRNQPGAMGYDNCVGGDYCLGPAAGGTGVCKTMCVQGGGNPACPVGFSCTAYVGVFGPPDLPAAAGVCEPSCDPLADNNFLGSSGGCGSGLGCFGFPDPDFGPTHWSCVAEQDYSRVHRTACDSTQHTGDHTACVAASVWHNVNGCASGYEPVYFDSEGTTDATCLALCQPASCYNTGSGSSAGSASCSTGSAANITGTAPYQCRAQRVQSAAFDEIDPTSPWSAAAPTVNNGEQCYYSWPFELDAAHHVVTSPTSDSVGFCVDHALLTYDPTGGSNATTTWPRCDAIGLGSGGYNVGAFDAASFGCVDTATARAHGDVMFNGKSSVHRMPLRGPYHPTAFAR
jgi:hypothetical protein